MCETLARAKVPFRRLMTYFVSGVEFIGGFLVAAGFLSRLASLALSVDMVVAILTTKLSPMPKGLSPLGGFDNLLYIPEVPDGLPLFWLTCSGPGKVSGRFTP